MLFLTLRSSRIVCFLSENVVFAEKTNSDTFFMYDSRFVFMYDFGFSGVFVLKIHFLCMTVVLFLCITVYNIIINF